MLARPATLAAVLVCLPVLAASLAAPPAVADEPPVWEAIGPEGVVATDLLWTERHHQHLFLATAQGYWLGEVFGGPWLSFEEPGVPGRALTAVTGIPRLNHRLITGRTDADGHGTLEIGFLPGRGADGDRGRDQVVYSGDAGPVADLAFTGWFDPVGLACTRALDDDAGALIASADTGNTWQPVAGHGHHDLTDVEVWSPGTWYVAGDAGVVFTEDGGETWHDRSAGLPAGTVLGLWDLGPIIAVPGEPAAAAGGAARDGDPFAYLLASMADGVYATTTDAVAWQRVLATPEPRQVLLQYDPWGQLDDVFVVTADGRLLKAIRGVWQWEDWTGDLAGAQIIGVVSHPDDLFVATATGGVFRTAYDIAGPSDVPAAPAPLALTAAPSPFNPRTVLGFTAPVAGHALLTVHDLRGRRLATLLDGPVAAGPQARTWQPRDLASGVYVARLLLGGQQARRSVVLVR